MGKVVVALSEEELIELQAVLVDGDERAALEFLQTRIAPKLPKKGTVGCDSTRPDPYLVRPVAKKR